jgi:hypothetical protein
MTPVATKKREWRDTAAEVDTRWITVESLLNSHVSTSEVP